MSGLARDTVIDNRYTVVSRLGTGGMADVFLVEDGLLGRRIALKLLHRRFAEDPAFEERFRREARAAAGLQQQNIVAIYDRGEYDGTSYIAMEYVPGRTLKEIITEEAPLDPVRAIDLTIQILTAARFAHRRGIVHRDLKPHNVIVDDAGNAKVTDFGIARAGASDMTETGSIMGTAQYLSPEQAQGHSVTASSDLYSVGIVLYEMLTGRVPFDGEQAVTIALKHVSEAPVPPREINPAIPAELEQTVLWTLNKNPADRPADAEQLITVLEHCREAIRADAAGRHTAAMTAVAAGAAAGMPVQGLPPLPPPTAAPVTHASGSIPVVIVPVAGDDGGPGDGEPPEEERGRWRPWLLGLLVLLLVCAAAAAAYLLTRPREVLVPSVRDQPYAAARATLRNAGFSVQRVRQTDAKTAGTVIGETPSGGSKADKGSTVTLIVSTGKGDVTIPSVEGESRATATATLKRAGLKVGHTTTQSSSTVSAGDAVNTSPPAGRSEPYGYTLTLVLSAGPAAKAVPDVSGYTQTSATTTLSNAGFTVHDAYTTTSSTTAGRVISQTPAGGTSEPEGTPVTITIARAPAMATVPTVKGDPVSNAFAALRAAGFTVNRTFTTVGNPANVGVVVSQSPGGQTRAAKGSSVSIVVGKAAAASSSGTATGPTLSTSTSSTSSTPTTTSSSSSGTATNP